VNYVFISLNKSYTRFWQRNINTLAFFSCLCPGYISQRTFAVSLILQLTKQLAPQSHWQAN